MIRLRIVAVIALSRLYAEAIWSLICDIGKCTKFYYDSIKKVVLRKEY
jgi:hypothetical protein